MNLRHLFVSYHGQSAICMHHTSHLHASRIASSSSNCQCSFLAYLRQSSFFASRRQHAFAQVHFSHISPCQPTASMHDDNVISNSRDSHAFDIILSSSCLSSACFQCSIVVSLLFACITNCNVVILLLKCFFHVPQRRQPAVCVHCAFQSRHPALQVRFLHSCITPLLASCCSAFMTVLCRTPRDIVSVRKLLTAKWTKFSVNILSQNLAMYTCAAHLSAPILSAPLGRWPVAKGALHCRCLSAVVAIFKSLGYILLWEPCGLARTRDTNVVMSVMLALIMTK